MYLYTVVELLYYLFFYASTEGFFFPLNGYHFDMYTVHIEYRRHEVDMTVRMVVHYKGLKMGMVRK